MTTLPDRFDVLVWRDGRNEPAVLGFGVTVTERRVEAEVLAVTRKMRSGKKRVQLVSEDGRRESVTVDWDSARKPALYGKADFKRI